MYTEYIFENKKYEVALRDIKATLFDIVSTEEANISALREKAFAAGEKTTQQDLQALFVRQDACLRKVLSISEQLSEALQAVDNCSRDLKQIENENLAQIVANIHGTVDVAEEEKVNRGKPKKLVMPVEEEVVAEPVREETPVVMETPQEEVHDEGDALARAKSEQQRVETRAASEPVAAVPNPEVAEPVMEYIDDLSTVKPVATPAPEEEVPQAPATEEVEPVMEYNDDLSTVKPMAEAVAEEKVEEGPVTQTPSTEPEPVMEYIDDLSTVKPIGEEAAADDGKTEEVIPESGPVLAPETTPGIIPVITGATVPEEETSSPVIIPTVTVAGGLTSESEESDDVLHLKKRGEEVPKAIMVSGKQAASLKNSLGTQEALLSAKGFFNDNDEMAIPEVSLEQQLVNNGLLAPDTEVTPAQIEQMMNQANELYAAGKVEEAQKMYDQISEMNKKLQGESVGIAK